MKELKTMCEQIAYNREKHKKPIIRDKEFNKRE